MYNKNSIIIRELPAVTIAYPNNYLLMEAASAAEKISVADFVNSYSQVYYTFTLSSNGNLYDSLWTEGVTLSSSNLGRVKLVWQGIYDPAVPYIKDDVVYYNGSSFIAVSAATNVTPVSGSSTWNLMVLGYPPTVTVTTVSNIVALRALNGILTSQVVNGLTVEVLGYYNPGDRGGGIFEWSLTSTATDDGGAVIKPTSVVGNNPGRWLRVLQGERPNVKMWGAQGTGTIDDTSAIQAALSAMQYGTALELIFTTGNYLISNTLQIPSNVKISGEGIAYNTSICMSQGISQNIMTTVAATTAGPAGFIPTNSGIIIENLSLYFKGYNLDSTANKTNTALVVQNPSTGAIIRNIVTYGGGYGIQCIGTSNDSLHIEDVSTNYAYIAGIQIQPAVGQTSESGIINIEDCFIFNNDVSSNSTAIWLQNEKSNINLKNISLSGSYGAGAILWNIPQLSAVNITPYLKVQNCIFNGDNNYTTNFITLSSSQSTTKTPVICIEGVTLNNCNNIIQDNITPYSIPSQTLSAIQPSVPFYYNVTNINSLSAQNIITSTKRINTSTSQFLPTTTGWYTIFTAQSGQAVANLSIASIHESTNFDVAFNNVSKTGFFKVNKFDTLSACATRARVLSYSNIVSVDIYVTHANIPLTISYRNDGQNNYKTDGLCIPTLIKNTPIQTLYSGYEEVTFDCGLIISNNSHIKLGNNYFWTDNNETLRQYNDGVNILFVSTIGSGAQARGYITNGSLTQVNVLSGGSGYTTAPLVYAISNNTSGGSGAILTATVNAGQVVAVNITNGGSGYGVTPTQSSGSKFITNTEFSMYGGEPIRNIRRLNFEQYTLSTAVGNSQIVTGFLSNRTSTIPNGQSSAGNPPNVLTLSAYSSLHVGINDLKSCLYPGDKLYKSNTSTVYEVIAVLDSQTAVVTPPITNQYTDAGNGWTKVGWEVFPVESNYRYVITGARALAPVCPNWNISTGGNTSGLTIALRTKGYTANAVLWYLNYQAIDNSSGDDYDESTMLQYFTPGTIVSPYLTSVNNGLSALGYGVGWGMGSILPPTLGISIDLVDSNILNYVLPGRGGLTLIEVFGYKYPINSNY